MKTDSRLEAWQNRILIVLVVAVVILGVMAFTRHAREIQRAAHDSGPGIMPVTVKVFWR